MNLRQMTGWGKTQAGADGEEAVDNTALCMTALVEGVAEAMPRIDAKTYAEFRGTAARMALRIARPHGECQPAVGGQRDSARV